MEGKRDRECLVQPEFNGLWDHKHRDYTVMIKLRDRNSYSYGQLQYINTHDITFGHILHSSM